MAVEHSADTRYEHQASRYRRIRERIRCDAPCSLEQGRFYFADTNDGEREKLRTFQSGLSGALRALRFNAINFDGIERERERNKFDESCDAFPSARQGSNNTEDLALRAARRGQRAKR